MAAKNEKIKRILKKIPHAPGIYKMIDEEGNIIYIGKAKDLAKRVKQYFQKSKNQSVRTQKMIEKIKNIQWTAVDSELEALLLETTLIKEHLPKYNVIMKDDKNYVYIKITNEEFPKIQIVRKVLKDGAKYIGPKSAAHKVKETFKILKKIFPFRHCNLNIQFIEKNKPKHKVKITNKTIKYPCLDYYIKRCIAPCIGNCTPEEYKKIIKNIENFLQGKADNILQDLQKQMEEHAKNKKFEKAAKTRDKIQKIQEILEKQKVSDPNQTDKDIINYLITRDKAYFNLFQVRDGKLIGQENFILSAKDLNESKENKEVLAAFIHQYYQLATDIPKEILIPHTIENKTEVKKWLKKITNKTVKFIIPKKGTKIKLLEMSLNNARIYADRNKANWQEESDLTERATKKLQKILKIKNPLKRIECYDISHLSGTDTVGSMIVFTNGAPQKKMYRKFKLRTIQGKPDDYKAMKEVLIRRFSKIALELKQKEYTFKKIRKKDHKFIEENNDVDLKKSDRNFYILEKNKKITGFIATKNHSKKVSELTNLWVSKNQRGKKLGYKLIKKAIEKTKAKRVYIICKRELKDYYAVLGFEEIKKLPDELKERCKSCGQKIKIPLFMVFDKNKHKKDESFSKTPDLVIIDGGKGQLNIAKKVFNDLKLKIPYISLAKKLESIYLPGEKKPIRLDSNNEALKLLQRARDEAHRFAISYNKQLRSKKLKI